MRIEKTKELAIIKAYFECCWVTDSIIFILCEDLSLYCTDAYTKILDRDGAGSNIPIASYMTTESYHKLWH